MTAAIDGLPKLQGSTKLLTHLAAQRCYLAFWEPAWRCSGHFSWIPWCRLVLVEHNTTQHDRGHKQISAFHISDDWGMDTEDAVRTLLISICHWPGFGNKLGISAVVPPTRLHLSNPTDGSWNCNWRSLSVREGLGLRWSGSIPPPPRPTFSINETRTEMTDYPHEEPTHDGSIPAPWWLTY